jgi:hypothetical protein
MVALPSAVDRVWALVSGLPPGKRERREFMVLQAYIDDSGNEPNEPIYVLAGFIAPSEAWAKFSAEWQAALNEPPGLAYFKMKEAERLQDEFDRRKGWDERRRDDRLVTFCRIIQRHAIQRVHASIKHADFAKYIRTLPTPIRRSISNHPYYLLFHNLMLTVAAVRMSFGQQGKVDFIFDEQGSLGEDAVHYWNHFILSAMRGTRTDFTPYLGKRPKFEDEKEFLTLQAADLYAWQLRRNIADNQGQIIVLPRIPLAILNQISPIGSDIGENQIRLLGDNLKEFAHKYAQTNPDARLLGPGEGKSETFRKSAKKSAVKRKKKPTAPSLPSDSAGESPC